MIFFTLGSQSKLSIAEIEAILNKDLSSSRRSEEILLVDDVSDNLNQLQNRLGGTIKVGQIIGELSEWNRDEAAQLISAYTSGATGKDKIKFGLSVYSLGEKKRAKEVIVDLKRLGLTVKKELQHFGRPVRYVQSKEHILSSVIVSEEGLLSSGGEFVLIATHNKILIGQTEAVQDFKAWSDRDYGRPKRDARSGMLPPKLARMMINLSGVDPQEKSLLDPFCGSGTILMEAALLGFDRLIGSDISAKAIKDTKKNLAWLEREGHTDSLNINVLESKVEVLDTVLEETVDVIVTETFLGVPRKGRETKIDLQKQIDDLMPMYISSIGILYKLLNPGGTMVIAFPAYDIHGEKELLRVPINEHIKRIGFSVTNRLLYKRDRQFVGRDIFVLIKD